MTPAVNRSCVCGDFSTGSQTVSILDHDNQSGHPKQVAFVPKPNQCRCTSLWWERNGNYDLNTFKVATYWNAWVASMLSLETVHLGPGVAQLAMWKWECTSAQRGGRANGKAPLVAAGPVALWPSMRTDRHHCQIWCCCFPLGSKPAWSFISTTITHQKQRAIYRNFYKARKLHSPITQVITIPVLLQRLLLCFWSMVGAWQ